MTRFVEKILQAPSIEEKYKSRLAQSTLIVGDAVADYYYRGSSQEIWSYATDFPNSAPPFGQFFIEFRAPRQIVSRVHGVHSWPAEGAREWGVLCTGTNNAQRLEATAHESGRAEMRFENLCELSRLWNTARSFLPDTAKLETLEADTRSLGLSGTHALIAEHVLKRQALARFMHAGQWDKVRDELTRQEHRWTLDLLLFVNVPRNGKEFIWGPIWHVRVYVKPNGSVVLTPDGEALLMEEPLDEIAARLEEMYQAKGGDYVELFDEAHREFTPFFHTAMLTVSFLHCRNVTLQQTSPPHKPLSNKQRRRGDIPRPRLTYHLLDILPIRQVLKTVGGEEHTGTKKALHICRGYFANYQEGRGLFGKYNGIYWFDQKVRGTSDKGIALKDYRVRT